MFEVRATPISPSYVKGLRSSCYQEAQPPRYTIFWHIADMHGLGLIVRIAP
jgi:hypothetical protein